MKNRGGGGAAYHPDQLSSGVTKETWRQVPRQAVTRNLNTKAAILRPRSHVASQLRRTSVKADVTSLPPPSHSTIVDVVVSTVCFVKANKRDAEVQYIPTTRRKQALLIKSVPSHVRKVTHT